TATAASGEAAVPDGQARSLAHARRGARRARGPARRARASDERRQGHAHLPARRQDRFLRRRHGGDESLARCGLFQSGAGGIGEGCNAMIALDYEDRADLLRWLLSGAIILAAHGAITASVLRQAPPADESVYGAASIVMIELQPVVPEPPKE